LKCNLVFNHPLYSELNSGIFAITLYFFERSRRLFPVGYADFRIFGIRESLGFHNTLSIA